MVDKPSGVAVHGGSGISHGVIELLRAARPELRDLALVHPRLDDGVERPGPNDVVRLRSDVHGKEPVVALLIALTGFLVPMPLMALDVLIGLLQVPGPVPGGTRRRESGWQRRTGT